MSQIEEYMRAVSNPICMSSEFYPDGTQKSNIEEYLDKYDEGRARSKDWH